MRIFTLSGLIIERSWGDIGFHAYYWLYALLDAGFVKLDNAVHIAVIGNSKALHSQLLGACDQFLYPGCAVQKAVFGMNMQMSERHVFSPLRNIYSMPSALSHPPSETASEIDS